MPKHTSAAILLGFEHHSRPWGESECRPFRTLYVVHDSSAPVIADEEATLNEDWGFPHSMVLRSNPADVAHDVAYFALARLSCQDDAMLGKARAIRGFEDWPVDARNEDGEERRRALHDAVAAAATSKGTLRLQIMRFDDEVLGDAAVKELEAIGVGVEVFGRD